MSTEVYLKEIRDAAIDKAVEDLAKEAANGSTGRAARHSYYIKIASLAAIGASIKTDALYKRVQRMRKQKGSNPPLTVHINLSASEVSSLSTPSVADNPQDVAVPTAEPTFTAESTSRNPQEAEAQSVLRSNVGRPKGSTVAKKTEEAKKYRDCLDAISFDYATELTAKKAKGRRCKQGYLDTLIKEKKEKFGVTKEISRQTIKSRIRRGNVENVRRGVRSPLEEAERALVSICIQMGKIRQPLNCNEAIRLMCDLIKGTPDQEVLRQFQMARTRESDQFGTVGKKWWRGFKKRHADQIVTRRGEKFACIRSDWTKMSNIAQMYDIIYDEMLDAGVAAFRETPVFTDRHGNVVNEDQRFGRIQNIRMKHADYVLFADESGCNTDQKKDGHIAGTLRVVEKGTVPQTLCSTNDHRFTILPFTSASGEVVCCVIIFQSATNEVPLLWKTGIDITSENPVLDSSGEIDFEANCGEGKHYPLGPKCKYRGKEVDCLTFASESGGISGDILVEILKYFDKIDLFPRVPGGPIPMLIVDGHQSRLDPKFIDYINDDGHVWKVCLGVPYATVLWQVGDASEQNGKFKVEWYKVKEDIMKWKFDHGLPQVLLATDIMPLMNRIFHKSYGDVRSNLKAVSDRGWYPLNRKLLEHPSLIDDSIAVDNATPSESQPTSNDTPSEQSQLSGASTVTLNIHDGMGATVLDRIIAARARSAGAKKAADERKRKGEEIVDNLRAAKRLTAGVIASNGIHSLNDPRFLQAFNEKRSEVIAKTAKSAADRRKRLLDKVSGVKKLREKYGDERAHLFAQFSSAECGVYLQYKKQSAKDPAMPKDLPGRRARCLEWMGRQSPVASPHASDDEMDDEEVAVEDEGEMDVSAAMAVAGLMGLGSSTTAVSEVNMAGNANEYGEYIEDGI